MAHHLRRRAISAYALGAVLSLVWGLSYELFYDKGIGADVRVGATGEGSTFINVHNVGRNAWSQVRIIADDHYFMRQLAVEDGGQVSGQFDDFINAYHIPRPLDVFVWEGVASRHEPETAPADFRPSTIRVETAMGETSVEVSF